MSGGYHAVVLAAGAGSRFGGAKLSASWGRGTLLDAAFRSACDAPVAGVVVVTGAHRQAVEAIVAGFAPAVGVRLATVHCADHARGMSASLRCGLAALPADAAGAFIFLGDMPRIPPGTADRLLDALTHRRLAAAPLFGERLGHPVLISRDLFAVFSGVAGDGGGGRILRDLGDMLARVPVSDERIFADVDTPADLARIQPAAPAPPRG